MESHGAEFRFNVDRFGIQDPANTVVYYRDSIGKGAFAPLRTRYNPNTRELVVDTCQVGEFCFGSPISGDLALLPPRPLSPVAGVKVSTNTPTTFRLSPQGIHTRLRYVVKNAAGETVVDTTLARDRFTTQQPLPAGRYTWNAQAIWTSDVGSERGRSGFSSPDSFEVSTPYLTINGLDSSQTWMRDAAYPITWTTNLSGKVRIELVNASGVMAKISDSISADLQGMLWRVPVAIPRGPGYGLRFTSLQGTEVLTEESGRVITIDEGSSVSSTWADGHAIGPNPASTSVLVGGKEELTRVMLFDVQGILRFESEVVGTGTRIDVSELPVGAYTLVVYSRRGMSTKTLSVQR